MRYKKVVLLKTNNRTTIAPELFHGNPMKDLGNIESSKNNPEVITE